MLSVFLSVRLGRRRGPSLRRSRFEAGKFYSGHPGFDMSVCILLQSQFGKRISGLGWLKGGGCGVFSRPQLTSSLDKPRPGGRKDLLFGHQPAGGACSPHPCPPPINNRGKPIASQDFRCFLSLCLRVLFWKQHLEVPVLLCGVFVIRVETSRLSSQRDRILRGNLVTGPIKCLEHRLEVCVSDLTDVLGKWFSVVT